jgi:hypothetical protein
MCLSLTSIRYAAASPSRPKIQGKEAGQDLAYSACVKSEQAMRQKLSKEWGTFAPAEKSHCIGSEKGGYASYTDLITCLEMARDARKMNN